MSHRVPQALNITNNFSHPVKIYDAYLVGANATLATFQKLTLKPKEEATVAMLYNRGYDIGHNGVLVLETSFKKIPVKLHNYIGSVHLYIDGIHYPDQKHWLGTWRLGEYRFFKFHIKNPEPFPIAIHDFGFYNFTTDWSAKYIGKFGENNNIMIHGKDLQEALPAPRGNTTVFLDTNEYLKIELM